MAETEMVERVARAMCEDDGANWNASDFGDTANGEEPEDQREYWLAKARAAIEAMRQPTDAMQVAGGLKCESILFEDNDEGTGVIFKDMGIVFMTMIDAALLPAPTDKE